MASSVLAQSFGPEEQTLIIAPAELRPWSNGELFDLSTLDGFLYGSGMFAAPIRLPEGAEITRVCLDAVDEHPDVDTTLSARTNGWSPGAAPTVDNWVTLTTSLLSGYGSVCSIPLSYDFRSSEGSGPEARHLRHTVVLGLPANGGWIGLGGVRIQWRRSVSPAPAIPTFGDVPTGDTAFTFIEALVASGITAGCGSGNFCPDAPLTRRQMAVFLSKALGLHWPY
jgi:hypothetical protein